jgi:hypothetical protein
LTAGKGSRNLWLVKAWSAKKKKRTVLIAIPLLLFILLLAGAVWFIDDYVAPLLFNSRIERLGETNLPEIKIEKGGIVYCRMKADDFRFPLPDGSYVVKQSVKGGFDFVDGSVEVRFESAHYFNSSEYQRRMSETVQIGGEINVETTSDGTLIKFHYFGDK